MTYRETRCLDCGYQSFNEDRTECSKCGGELEILASSDIKEIIKEKRK